MKKRLSFGIMAVVVVALVLFLGSTAFAQAPELPTDMKGSLVFACGLAGVVPLSNGPGMDFTSGYVRSLGAEYFLTDHFSVGALMNSRTNDADSDIADVSSVGTGSPQGYIRYVMAGPEDKTRTYVKLGIGWGNLEYYAGDDITKVTDGDVNYGLEGGVFYQFLGKFIAGGKISANDLTDAFRTAEVGAVILVPIWKLKK